MFLRWCSFIHDQCVAATHFRSTGARDRQRQLKPRSGRRTAAPDRSCARACVVDALGESLRYGFIVLADVVIEFGSSSPTEYVYVWSNGPHSFISGLLGRDRLCTALGLAPLRVSASLSRRHVLRSRRGLPEGLEYFLGPHAPRPRAEGQVAEVLASPGGVAKTRQPSRRRPGPRNCVGPHH